MGRLLADLRKTRDELAVLLEESHGRRRLAKDVLLIAAAGGMPDTYWHTDTRVLRALETLGVLPSVGRRWAHWAATAGRQ